MFRVTAWYVHCAPLAPVHAENLAHPLWSLWFCLFDSFSGLSLVRGNYKKWRYVKRDGFSFGREDACYQTTNKGRSEEILNHSVHDNAEHDAYAIFSHSHVKVDGYKKSYSLVCRMF